MVIGALSAIASAQLIKPESPVKITLQPATEAESGKTIEAKLNLEIKPNWHLFSEKPEISGITATQIHIEPSDHFTLEKVIFPKPQSVYSDVFAKNLNLYQGKVALTLVLKLHANFSGEIPIKGSIKYQACSDALCLPPKSENFEGSQTVP
jgi:DsbC/DsbD-like thiol-disulfide interchange protein